MNTSIIQTLSSALAGCDCARGMLVGKTADGARALACVFSVGHKSAGEVKGNDLSVKEKDPKETAGEIRRFGRFVLLSNYHAVADVIKSLGNEELFESVLRPLSWVERSGADAPRLSSLLMFSGQSFVYRINTIDKDAKADPPRPLRSTFHYIPTPGRFHLLTESHAPYAEPVTLSLEDTTPEELRAHFDRVLAGKPYTLGIVCRDLSEETATLSCFAAKN